MTRRRFIDVGALDRLLGLARAALPEARARFDAHVATIADLLPDPRRMREAGRMLDMIARGKLYRIAGHKTFDDFVRSAFGISRTTAYRLRRIARAPDIKPKHGKTAIYEAARRATSKPRARGRAQPRSRRPS